MQPFGARLRSFDGQGLQAVAEEVVAFVFRLFGALADAFAGGADEEREMVALAALARQNIIAEAEKVMDRMLSNAKIAVMGKHPLSDFLSPSGEGNKFTDIETEILNVIQSQVRANNYGMEVVFLGIKKLGLPENVTASVFERMQSERKVLVEKSQTDGERDAQIIRSEADRNANELLAKADSEATQIRGKGEAEAAKSLKAFQENPELANFLFSLSALENSLKEKSTLIFDQHTPPFDLFGGASTNLLKK